MHFKIHQCYTFWDSIFCRVLRILSLNLNFSFVKHLFHFVNFTLDSAFDCSILNHVIQDLFKDHDGDEIHLKFFVILVEENVDKVGYVGVDELKDVRFVDH